MIEGKIKRGLVAAAAGHTLKFTSSSVEFTHYIYIYPKAHQEFLLKKHKRKSNSSAPGFFHSGNLL